MSYFFIDGNSLGFAGQHGKPLSTDGQYVHAVFYFLKTLKKTIDSYTAYQKPIVLWDNRALFRKELYPDYKANRSDTPEKIATKEQYKSQIPLIRRALTTLSVDQLAAEGFEADDIAGLLVRKSTAAGRKSLLVTGDEDWCQLVNSLTSWYDPRKGGAKYCNRSGFKEFTGVDTPSQFLQIKALEGDVSDNIAGIDGIGKKSAQAIMSEFGGIKSLVREFIDGGREFKKGDLPPSLSRARNKINKFLNNDFKVFTRNMRLMDLQTGARDEQIKKALVTMRGNASLENFVDFCGDYSFMSIIRNKNEWARTFRID